MKEPEDSLIEELLRFKPEIRRTYFLALWDKHSQKFANYGESEIGELIKDIEIQNEVNDSRDDLKNMLIDFFSDALAIDPQKAVQVYNLLPDDLAKLFRTVYLSAQVLIERGSGYKWPRDELRLGNNLADLKALAREDEIQSRAVALFLLKGPLKRME